MFERLAARVLRKAERRARSNGERLAAALKAELPRGISAEAEEAGVILAGRALKRRFMLDPRLLWLMARLK